jgi:hypothetical protein
MPHRLPGQHLDPGLAMSRLRRRVREGRGVGTSAYAGGDKAGTNDPHGPSAVGAKFLIRMSSLDKIAPDKPVNPVGLAPRYRIAGEVRVSL